MRRIAVALMGTISGLVMLFSYRTSLHSQAAPPASTVPPTVTSAPSATPSTSASGSPPKSSSSGTYTGDAVDTRWGVVQVQITVQNGKIVQSQAVQYPQNNQRDVEINAYAVPVLNQEAVQYQTGTIDAISGATVTSDGYIASLQSAIDKAHL